MAMSDVEAEIEEYRRKKRNERMQKWREKTRSDPVKYAEYLAKQREYNRHRKKAENDLS